MRKLLLFLMLVAVLGTYAYEEGREKTFYRIPEGMIADTDLGMDESFGVIELVPFKNNVGYFVFWPSDVYNDPVLAVSQPDTLQLVGDFPWAWESVNYFPPGETFKLVPGGHYSGVFTLPQIAYNYNSQSDLIARGRVKVISTGAFANCTELTKVVFTKQLKQIRRGAFYGCTALEEVVANGAKDVKLFHYAFRGCTSLRKIDLTFASHPEEYNYYYYFDSIFADCPNLAEVTITASTGNVRNLYGRTHASLRRINLQIPEDVTLRNEAGDMFFDEEYQQALLVVPDEAMRAIHTVLPWCNFVNRKTTSEMAGIENVSAAPNAELVNVEDGVMTLIDYDSTVEVFAVSGAKVAVLSAASPSLDNVRGYYIVRGAAGIQKVFAE